MRRRSFCWSNLDCCIGPKNRFPQASGKKDPLIGVHSQTGTAGYSSLTIKASEA